MKTIQDLVYKFKNRKNVVFNTDAGVTYDRLRQDIIRLGKGFYEKGVGPGDRVMLISGNRPEWMLASLALNNAGIIDVPRGRKASDNELNYILKHSRPSAVIVEDGEILKRLAGVPRIFTMEKVDNRPSLHDLIKLGEQFSKGIAEFIPETPASHLYTSGTTGEPKGAVLTHNNFISNMNESVKRFPLVPEDLELSVLPLWHVFERLVQYVCLYSGVNIHYSTVPRLKDDLQTVRPTVMAVVPRILEKVYDGKVMKEVRQKSAVQQGLFHMMIRLAAGGRAKGLNPMRLVGALPVKILEEKVFAKVKEGFGGRLKFLICGGGKLRKEVDRFFCACGLPVLEGYGLTETSPVIAVRSVFDNPVGTVGKPLDNLRIKILDPDTGKPCRRNKTGVIYVKGPSVMKEYYRNAYETGKAKFNGWFDTGDLGYLDRKGNLVITGRKKNIIVLSNGENISPEPIEETLKKSPLIANVVVIGQDWKSLGALIEPDFEKLEELCKDIGEDLEHPKVKRALKRMLREYVSPLTGFREYECIKSFRLLEKPLEPGKEMTETLKLKRRVIEQAYGREIEEIYNEIHGVKG